MTPQEKSKEYAASIAKNPTYREYLEAAFMAGVNYIRDMPVKQIKEESDILSRLEEKDEEARWG